MSEQWKPIKGYEGIYEVSSLGRVRSLDRIVPALCHKTGTIIDYHRKGRILKQRKVFGGYMAVGFEVKGDNRHENHFVHRLVARAFVPGYREGMDVNHKDEDKTNNRADNLEWCTKEYKCNYGQHHEKQKAALAHWMHRVTQLTLDGQPVATYPSVSEAARAAGVTCKAIRLCISGKHKHCKGYQWRYTDEQTFTHIKNV